MNRYTTYFGSYIVSLLLCFIFFKAIFAEDTVAASSSISDRSLGIDTFSSIPVDMSSSSPMSLIDIKTQVITPFDIRPITLSVSNMLSNRIIAYYGHPNSKKMGILGRLPIDQLSQKLEECAFTFDLTNNRKTVIPAFYIIYGTCQPGGAIAHLNKAMVEKYVLYAQKKGYIVFLDHQIGKYTVEEAMNRLLPFLKYQNVHLALDPEWRTLTPMKNIGSITAEELNTAQAMMRDYMLKNQIQDSRILVVHQFNHVMIKNRHRVRSDYDPVFLVHTQDGFGSPDLKRGTYAYNAAATNMPYKGFKLFYRSGYRGAGYDDPLMTPEEVVRLKPEPFIIMYQ